jgi:radical SAM protein with 4Fe4S-binding SPASM domain
MISFTAHRANFREFPQVAEVAHHLRAFRVWSDRLVPIGRGSTLEALTPQETRELFDLMAASRGREQRRWFHRAEIPMHRALQFLAGGPSYRCTAGDTLISIQPNGDVYPCRRLPIRIGNVFETPLAVLYRDSSVLRSLRDPGRTCRGCESCPHETRCRGGLRCLSFASTSDPFRADPGCWLAKC